MTNFLLMLLFVCSEMQKRKVTKSKTRKVKDIEKYEALGTCLCFMRPLRKDSVLPSNFKIIYQ